MRPFGFTLVEMLIVLALTMLLFGVISTIATNTHPKIQLRAETEVVVQTLRHAQAWTLAQKQDSTWGVYRTASDITLFVGSSYATRDPLYDQVHLFPSGITTSGLTEVVFDLLRGTTSNTGNIVLTSTATSESYTISVNANGVIDY